MTNMMFGSRFNAPVGPGMIGSYSYMNSANSSSSSINEYAQFIPNFENQYMYEGYPQHFSNMHLQPLSMEDHLSYAATAEQIKSELLEHSAYSSTLPFNRTGSPTQPVTSPTDMASSNHELIPPSASTPTSHPDQEPYTALPCGGGMGGFVPTWNYETASGSLPLSLMHSSPLKTQHFDASMIVDPESNLPAGHSFLSPGFSFASHLYPHADSAAAHSDFAMAADPAFMMWLDAGAPSAISDTLSTTRKESVKTYSKSKKGSEKRKAAASAAASASGGTVASRKSRGQIMVLKGTGDMIAELDDGVSDSAYRSSVPRRYMCSVCNKRFTRPSTLRTHMNSHTGERPYHCSTSGCEWKFTVLSNLKRHQRICAAGKLGAQQLGAAEGEFEGDNDWKP
ncbi:hypothetical protein HDU98_008126 [Podochytrium sp. JEL0797]|nr:hypothetical protein HDU98_008126 [Podochytrium sp. JEL0797]